MGCGGSKDSNEKGQLAKTSDVSEVVIIKSKWRNGDVKFGTFTINDVEITIDKKTTLEDIFKHFKEKNIEGAYDPETDVITWTADSVKVGGTSSFAVLCGLKPGQVYKGKATGGSVGAAPDPDLAINDTKVSHFDDFFKAADDTLGQVGDMKDQIETASAGFAAAFAVEDGQTKKEALQAWAKEAKGKIKAEVTANDDGTLSVEFNEMDDRTQAVKDMIEAIVAIVKGGPALVESCTELAKSAEPLLTEDPMAKIKEAGIPPLECLKSLKALKGNCQVVAGLPALVNDLVTQAKDSATEIKETCEALKD